MLSQLKDIDVKEFWPEFEKEMMARLERGKKEYGDQSFTRPAWEIGREIEEELLDVVGWAFILWVRARHLKQIASQKNPS